MLWSIRMVGWKRYVFIISMNNYMNKPMIFRYIIIQNVVFVLDSPILCIEVVTWHYEIQCNMPHNRQIEAGIWVNSCNIISMQVNVISNIVAGDQCVNCYWLLWRRRYVCTKHHLSCHPHFSFFSLLTWWFSGLRR